MTKRRATRQVEREGEAKVPLSRTLSVRLREPLLDIFLRLAAVHAPGPDGAPEVSRFLERIIFDWIEWHAGEHQLPQPRRRGVAAHRRRSNATEAVQEVIRMMSSGGEVEADLALRIAQVCDLLANLYFDHPRGSRCI